MKISFINAVASVCESVGANVNQVCPRRRNRLPHWSQLPESRHRLWRIVFPKDVMAFRAVARECGYDFRLLDEVMRINEDQRQRFLRKVRSALWTLRGKNLGVLGLAFKGGTDDIRESPALFLVQSLVQQGSRITAYDPAAMERAREVLTSGVTVRQLRLRGRAWRRCLAHPHGMGGVRQPRSQPPSPGTAVSHRH